MALLITLNSSISDHGYKASKGLEPAPPPTAGTGSGNPAEAAIRVSAVD